MRVTVGRFVFARPVIQFSFISYFEANIHLFIYSTAKVHILNINFNFNLLLLLLYRVLTRVLKVGVRDSLFIKSRSPSQKVGVPLPKNRSPIFFFFFMTLL